MTDDARRTAFAAAFYRQAASDWQVYLRLTQVKELPVCHQLHYLQMACEKLAKAYRLRDLAADVDELAKKHTGFVKFINAFLLSPQILTEYEKKHAALQAIRQSAAAIARGVEELAPAIDRLHTPTNAEYPWESAGRVVAPCDHTYPSLSLLHAAGGRAFLKLVERAFRDYESERVTIQ